MQIHRGNPLPRPVPGGITRAAERTGIGRHLLSRTFNRHRFATLGEALALHSDPEIGPLGINLVQWTGVQLPAGMPLGNGLYALPGRPGSDGFIVPDAEPVHPGQLDMETEAAR